MKIIDISRPVLQAPVHPTGPKTEITRTCSIKDGCDSNFSLISTNSHAGTHADATLHFVDGGAGIGDMPLEDYYGPCRVFTVEKEGYLSKEDFEGRIDGTERLLINGGGKAFLDESAARYFVERGLRLFGTDACSPGTLENEAQIHRILISGQVRIIENINLSKVEDGEYTLVAFPVNYGECDGAPVRAALFDGK